MNSGEHGSSGTPDRTAAANSPVETALPPTLKAKFDYKEALSKALLMEDRSAIYGGFHLYVMES